MPSSPPEHVPVLLPETLALLAPRAGETALDCTAGRGGHAEALARAVDARPGGPGRLVVVDLDEDALASTAARLEAAGLAAETVQDSFVRAPRHLRRLGLAADVVLADLGFGSHQMDDAARGFSFRAEGPLDMRFDRRSPVTAADLLRTLDERQLADVIHRYGEEPLARRIATAIVRARSAAPVETTAALAELVVRAYGPRARSSRLHPATRTFMALRIAVNDELAALAAFLDQVREAAADLGAGRATWLEAGARVAIIAFHSLEDRIVKQVFSALEKEGLADRLTRKPVRASEPEQQANPRARSGRLRAVRIGDARRATPPPEASPPVH